MDRGLTGRVVHLDPADRVWSEMLTGFEQHLRARALRQSTVESQLRTVRAFHVYSDKFPWQWTTQDVDAWSSDLLTIRHVARSTLRGYQGCVRSFCSYVTSPAYRWDDICWSEFGEHVAQVCYPWNTVRHSDIHEGRSHLRPFMRAELEQFFDTIDDMAANSRESGRKGTLALYRDSAMFKVGYAYGLRRNELSHLSLKDFSPNPKMPNFGQFGALRVRYGKASAGSGHKRRTVLTAMPWIVPVLEQYVREVRPLFKHAAGSSLWPSEREPSVSSAYLSKRFLQLRREASLPEDLHLHCLRRSYVTHLLEDGWEERFVQEQVGHAWASTTALYAGVSSDYKNRMLARGLRSLLGDRAGGEAEVTA